MYRKDKKEEFYTQQAHKENYPARSIYKLKEIDERFKIIKRGDIVLDIGSAPGSWLLYVSKKIGERGLVFGIDIQELKIEKKDNIIFLNKDIKDFDFLGYFKDKKFNLIIADLSPKTTGIKSIDSAMSLELAEMAFDIAQKTLKNKGNFICKVFESQDTKNFLKEVSFCFKDVRKFIPKAVAKRSREFYIVAKKFKA